MNPEINQLLGEGTAPPEETVEKENPLEGLNEAVKGANKKEPEEKDTAEKIDDDLFEQMLMSGDNSEGLFTPKEKEDKDNPLHEDVDEKAKVKQVKITEKKGKYAKKFVEDITKNPNDYKVQTPKGEMTIAEAMRKGYNPITKRFEKDKSSEAIKEKHLSGLNNAQRSKLEEITSPSAAHMAPKDAEAMGLPPDSPMIDGMGQPPMAPQAGAQTTAIPSEATGAPAPMPGQAPATGQEGGLDIASMLGGM